VRERADAAERAAEALKEQVSHLQHTVRAQHAEVGSLRRERAELAAALEASREEAGAAKGAAAAAGAANATLRERLALFSGVLGGVGAMEGAGEGAVGEAGLSALSAVPPAELERALTLVRRRADAGAGGGEGEESSALRKRVQALQLALVSAQREGERAEALLRAQTAIAGDLGAEAEELRARLAAEAGGARRRATDAEALAARRQARIELLEAQIKQLIAKCKDMAAARRERAAAAAAGGGGGGGGGGGARRARAFDGWGSASGGGGDGDGDGDTVISELSGGDEGREGGGGGGAAEDSDDSVALGDFGPGEDALEVYVVSASLDSAALPFSAAAASTFAVLEFFTFASQASPLAGGAAPAYNFSATYRVPVDGPFLAHVVRSGFVLRARARARPKEKRSPQPPRLTTNHTPPPPPPPPRPPTACAWTCTLRGAATALCLGVPSCPSTASSPPPPAPSTPRSPSFRPLAAAWAPSAWRRAWRLRWGVRGRRI
jgi:hypothetical protein